MIFLVLTEDQIEKNIESIQRAGNSIRGVELRADFLQEAEFDRLNLLIDYCQQEKLKTIFTLRRPQDGGSFNGGQAQFEALCRLAVSARFDQIDLDDSIENDAFALNLQKKGIGVIRSIHDFNGIPSHLVERMKAFANSGFIPKAAVMIKGTADWVRFIAVADALQGVDKILIGMGSAGFPSRVLTQRLGSLLTFCSWGIDPRLGQVDPLTLANGYGYYGISSKTRLAGIIGNPVMHTRSPFIHNEGYRKNGLDALYLPFETDDLDQFQEVVKLLHLRGVSVTIPHKERVLPFLSRQESAVEEVGACNTVLFHHLKETAGQTSSAVEWEGFNTDVEGFLRPLQKRIEESCSAKQTLQVGVIGAGGAARAVLFALKSIGAEVVLFNRTYSKAVDLADHFGTGGFVCKPEGLDALSRYSGQFAVLVQCSGAGMGKLAGVDPSEGYRFSGKEIAYEIIYSPERTLFVQRAQEAGCEIIGGLEMLHAQAQRQFEIFTDGKRLD